MKNPIYIISDNHFSMNSNNEEEIDRRNKLFKVFDKIKKQKDGTLIIGGDFFDYWFEYTNVMPSGYESILESLKSLVESGIEIHYVLGNHDYWDFGYLNNEIGITTHKRDLNIDHNNDKILITHGDGLLKNDYGYRIMRKIIRHPIFIKIFNLFPPSFTCKIANKISKVSSHYNHHPFDNHADLIKKDILEFAQVKWKEGINTVLVGHYHQTGIIKENNNKLIFLGDWLSKFTVTVINEKKYWQGDWKNFIDLA